MKSNRVEVEGLFDKRSSAEQAFLERYMAAAEAYERQLEDLRCADAEDYNLLKVRWGHIPDSRFRVPCFTWLRQASELGVLRVCMQNAALRDLKGAPKS